jgi:hypothetical protein
MLEKNTPRIDHTVNSESIDSGGAPIGVVRMDPLESIAPLPQLLQRYINDSDSVAWQEIRERIDYTYGALDVALRSLDKATGFGEKVKAQVKEGKKALFKPNIVTPICIDPVTHGEGP